MCVVFLLFLSFNSNHNIEITQIVHDQNSGPGLIPGSWIMMRHVSCILLLEWSTTSQRLWVYTRITVPYAQKDPRFLFEKRRGQPQEFWSLVSTIDGRTVWKICYAEQTGKTYPKKKPKKKKDLTFTFCVPVLRQGSV